MVSKNIIAHELGHMLSAVVQDGFWIPTSLKLKGEYNTLAHCACKQETKMKKIRGPYVKIKGIMDLGGIFGELLWSGSWRPWGCRQDVDDFTLGNKNLNNILVVELDYWLWVDDDELSFRACSQFDCDSSRRQFMMDHHDTCKRLPELWKVYLDFCDRIDKISFKENVIDISKHKRTTIGNKELKKIIKDIVHG